jgi:hypothetical protein
MKATIIKPDFICNKIVPEGTPDLSGTAFNHALGCSATAVSRHSREAAGTTGTAMAEHSVKIRFLLPRRF